VILIGPLHRQDYLEEHRRLAPEMSAKYRL
jgi:hypothetical protein